MTTAGPELRVLGGAHQGASVALPSLGASLTLGHDPDNDVILQDAPFASGTWRSTVKGGLWRDESGEYLVTLGQGLRFGAMTLAVCLPADPWELEPLYGWAVDKPATSADQTREPEALDPSSTMDAAPGEPRVQEAPSESHADDIRLDPELETASPQKAKPPAVMAGRSQNGFRSLGTWTRVAVAGVMVMAAGWLTFSWLETPSPTALASKGRLATASTQAAASTPARAAVDANTVKAVAQAVKALGTPGEVKAALYAGGRIQLSGVVDNDENMERIVRAAAAVTPLLKLSLMTQGEFAQRVKALGATLPDGASLRSEPLGVVIIAGTVSDDTTMDNVRSLVAEEFPMASRVVTELMTAQQRAELEAKALAARTPKVPELSAVVSGSKPYVVLPDGQKIQPGGLVMGLRVASISADAVIFEDASGARFKWTR
ncbi:MAG: hypothetical protein RI949_3034 [Pseudomonadota bacterium]